MEPWLIVVLSVIGTLVVHFLVGLIAAGGNFEKVGLARRCAWRLLSDADFADKVRPLLTPPPPKPTGPPKPSGEPLRLLALLQREGRLLDFLLEDIQSYPDAQIGAAVRDIHRQCHGALKEHLILEPVLPQSEGSTVQVPGGFDPSAIRLTGNVTGQPPFQGTLQHHGWRVKEMKLARRRRARTSWS